MKTLTPIAGVLLALAACTPKNGAARHTVQDYRADRTLRQEVFRQCTNDPGTLKTTPDCINAQEAERLESFDSLRNSPPLGLDPKKKP